MVFEKGIQVEWMEFDDYMSYMIYCEGIAVHSEVAHETSHYGHGVDVHWVLQELAWAGSASTGGRRH